MLEYRWYKEMASFMLNAYALNMHQTNYTYAPKCILQSLSFTRLTQALQSSQYLQALRILQFLQA